MSNNLKDHIRNEFIEAAKRIALQEGTGAVTARRLGKETGYSYATVYSYFNKMDSLVWQVGLKLNEDMAKIYHIYDKKKDFIVKDIEYLFIEYVKFHFENPNIFRLFLDQKIDEPSQEIWKQMVSPEVNKLVYYVLGDVLSERVEDEVRIIADMLMSSVYGLLAMHFGSIPVIDEDSVISQIKKQIRFLCG